MLISYIGLTCITRISGFCQNQIDSRSRESFFKRSHIYTVVWGINVLNASIICSSISLNSLNIFSKTILVVHDGAPMPDIELFANYQ